MTLPAAISSAIRPAARRDRAARLRRRAPRATRRSRRPRSRAEQRALHRVGVAAGPSRGRVLRLPVPRFGADARLAEVAGARAHRPRRARRRHRPPRAESRCRSNGPSRSRRPLPTQFSATPPARHRLLEPVSRCAVLRHPQHHLFGDLLDRRGKVHLALRQRRFGLARRAAEQPRRTPPPVIVRPWTKSKYSRLSRMLPSSWMSTRWSRIAFT